MRKAERRTGAPSSSLHPGSLPPDPGGDPRRIEQCGRPSAAQPTQSRLAGRHAQSIQAVRSEGKAHANVPIDPPTRGPAAGPGPPPGDAARDSCRRGAHVGGTTFLATILIGAEEAPGPGDSDGIGAVVLALKPSTGQVCWAYTVRRVDPITTAHIHLAPVGGPGPVVVPLGASGNRSFSVGCTTADPAVVAAIVADPDAYYVNVHNAAFPAGALRGQLH